METAGWLLLGVSWGTITTLVVFCLVRVLRADRGRDRSGGAGN
jgi:hypothetical protein